MSNQNRVSILIYYSLLSSYLVVSFFPDLRVWGLNWWAFYPLWVKLALFAIGAAVPALLYSPLARGMFESTDNNKGRFAQLWWLFPVAAALIFWFGRVGTHFLGDGYTLLSNLADSKEFALKPHEVGETIAHIGLFRLLGTDSEATATLAYQLIAVASGTLFTVLLCLAARKLALRPDARLWFVLGCLTGGYSLMFLGYVENYSIFITAVAAFTVAGLLSLESKLNRWWVFAAFVLASLMHVFGLVLLPGMLVVLLHGTRPGRKIAHASTTAKASAVAAILVAGATLFFYWRADSYFFRFAFLPVVNDRFTVDNQTITSIAHLIDFANLWLLLIPGLPVALSFFMGRWRRTKGPGRIGWFFLLTIGAGALAIFVIDPKLGMPRDWDLFAFCAVPATIALFYYLMRDDSSPVERSRIAGLICTLGLLVLLPRAAALSNAGIILEHVRVYRQLDPHRLLNLGAALSHYGDLTADPKAEELWRNGWEDNYRVVQLFDEGVYEMNRGNYAGAVAKLRASLREHPGFWNSWTTLGASLIRMNHAEGALEPLRISLGINRYGTATYNNLGAAYLQLGRYDEAEKALRKATELDSSVLAPYLGLITIYTRTANRVEYEKVISYVTSRPDAPLIAFEQYIDFMVKSGRTADAIEGLREAIKRGMDSAKVAEIRQRYELPSP